MKNQWNGIACANDDIDFQDVADVIAIARIAGVDRVGLLTEDGKHVPVAG